MVEVGETALAIFSICARVSSVLQSAGFFAAAVLPAAVLGAAGQTPLMVSTTAFSGTSGGGAGAFAAAAGAGVAGAIGASGCACPQASVPRNTHTNQLLCIQDSSRIGRSGSYTTEPSILA